ncbi:MAG TPA: hypothetical protein VH120_11525 [Gemmataceae bacterium]|jgi:hypothetical protein|nr:hypothetical protein [Gemmataceae bacterium]
MTHDDALLNRLSEWRPEGAGPHSFGHTRENGWTVHATAESTDTVGCRLTELAVGRPAPEKPATAADLKKWGGRIAGRVTGLLEPLKLIEVDAARSEAVLRSEAPASRGTSVEYYEVLLRGRQSASLKRYKASRAGSGKRRAVPFALTHEAIAKIADDLTAE